jgi:hypothetical protein
MMTQLRWMMIVVLALLAVAVPAAAAEPAGESEAASASVELPSTEKEIRYKVKTEIDFGERKVNGVLSGPMGVYADSLADQQWNPLIRLRSNFDREILASTESIR